jgi:hypothetical protein
VLHRKLKLLECRLRKRLFNFCLKLNQFSLHFIIFDMTSWLLHFGTKFISRSCNHPFKEPPGNWLVLESQLVGPYFRLYRLISLRFDNSGIPFLDRRLTKLGRGSVLGNVALATSSDVFIHVNRLHSFYHFI